MNLLALLPTVLKGVGKVLGLNVFNDAATALQNATLTPEQQTALQSELAKHEEAMAQINLDALRTIMSESIAEIQSSDKYVARARPTGLYIFYGVSATIAVGMLFGVKIDPAAILTILGPLAGVGGTYVYQRTQEKKAGAL